MWMKRPAHLSRLDLLNPVPVHAHARAQRPDDHDRRIYRVWSRDSFLFGHGMLIAGSFTETSWTGPVALLRCAGAVLSAAGTAAVHYQNYLSNINPHAILYMQPRHQGES